MVGDVSGWKDAGVNTGKSGKSIKFAKEKLSFYEAKIRLNNINN